MSRKDYRAIAAALAEVESIIETTGDAEGHSASTLRLVVDAVGGALKRDNARFDYERFQAAALPIQTERKVRIIRETLARS